MGSFSQVRYFLELYDQCLIVCRTVSCYVDSLRRAHDSYWLEAYRGTGAEECVLILSRSSSCEVITAMETSPKPEKRIVPAMEVPLTWFLQELASPQSSGTGDSSQTHPLSPKFCIDKSHPLCYTPRRNPNVETALEAMRKLSHWCNEVHAYFDSCVFSQALDKQDLDMSAISPDSVFVPVLPLLHPSGGESYNNALIEGNSASMDLPEQKQGDDVHDVVPSSLNSLDNVSTTLSVGDTNAFLLEHHRTLSAQCDAVAKVFPPATAHRSLISSAEGTMFLTLMHLCNINEHYSYGVDYLEELLRDQLTSAIGKVVQSRDFSQYMKYHNARLLRPSYRPRPFCYSVRRSCDHAPEGGVFLEERLFGEEKVEAVSTLVSTTDMTESGPVERHFMLSASTTVTFTGSTHVHAYMSHRFENEHQKSELQLRSEARQFSGYIVLIGTIPSSNAFDPQHAFICQNKDEFTIPLDAEMIPSPKAFRDAIQSLSPEQQRFAKAFRSMQLASTLFGVLIIQIKPQLEKVLNLPPDSLTKEIKLTQDLMELFIKYQIPSDLLSYESTSVHPGDVVSVREKLEAVKGHVSAMHEMIGLTKRRELEKRIEEEQYRLSKEILERARRVEEEEAVRKPTIKKAVKQTINRSSCLVTAPPPRPPAAPGGGPPVSNVKNPPATDSSRTVINDSSKSTTNDKVTCKDFKKDASSTGNSHCSDDFTLLPNALNEKFEQLDKDGAVRPVILSLGKVWKKRSQKSLLTSATTASLNADDQKDERSAAFDLLDALSRSGGLTIDNTDLHVVLMSTHCFDKTLMNTIIEKNTNPIEKMEQSTLIMASVIHGGCGVEVLSNDSEHERLRNHSTMLFELGC